MTKETNTIDLFSVFNITGRSGNQDIKVTNTERLNRFLCFGGDVDSINEYNETLLHEVAKSEDIETAKYLIEKGANINAINVDGETPLMYAVRSNNEKMIQLLIDAGADGFLENNNGRDAIQIARHELSSNHSYSIANLLMSKLYTYTKIRPSKIRS